MTPAGEDAWGGLCISESLPFEFRPAGAPPTPLVMAEANATNLQTLIVDATLGEARRGAESSELDANRQSDLERIESKVDVLLGMVARLAAGARPPGPPRRLRLFAQGLEWEASAPEPPAGQAGIVHLQVNPAFPQRLVLPGAVAGVRRGADGDWVQFRFEGIGDRVVAMLERLIFRRHRRQVAGTHG
ncbi:MAG TPA: PilZ domain-containing protein [Solirubrobacteraceae bacterium]|nr:PilZ domain-containing protein [Solirubrobacteraceae bacterium]